MNRHTGRFVDNHQILILIQNINGQIYRKNLIGGSLLPDAHGYHISGPQHTVEENRLPVDQNAFRLIRSRLRLWVE